MFFFVAVEGNEGGGRGWSEVEKRKKEGRKEGRKEEIKEEERGKGREG